MADDNFVTVIFAADASREVVLATGSSLESLRGTPRAAFRGWLDVTGSLSERVDTFPCCTTSAGFEVVDSNSSLVASDTLLWDRFFVVGSDLVSGVRVLLTSEVDAETCPVVLDAFLRVTVFVADRILDSDGCSERGRVVVSGIDALATLSEDFLVMVVSPVGASILKVAETEVALRALVRGTVLVGGNDDVSVTAGSTARVNPLLRDGETASIERGLSIKPSGPPTSVTVVVA